jgi:parvulin-like peptidyl-prolyl isomerase
MKTKQASTLPLFLAGLFLFFGRAVPCLAAMDPATPLATLKGEPVTLGDYNLFVRNRYNDLMSLRPNLPSHEDYLRLFAIYRVLAASAEAEGATVERFPKVRWTLWKLECSEALVRLQEEIFQPKSDPSNEEIARFYEEHKETFEEPGSFSFRNIFFDSTVCKDEKCRNEMKEKARSARTDLVSLQREKAVPLDRFLEIASEQAGKPADQILVRGPFPLGKVNPALEAAAMSLEPGEISEVVETQGGYQIIRLETKAVPGLKPLSEVREPIRLQIVREETERRRDEFDRTHRGEKSMTIHEDALSDMIASLNASQERSIGDKPLAEAGSFKIGTLDFLAYLLTVGVRVKGYDPEEEKDLLSKLLNLIKKKILYPELRRQDAEQLGFTRDATYEARFRIGRLAILGTAKLGDESRKRLEALPPITSVEMMEYYNAHPAEFTTQPTYCIREIAVAPKPADTPVQKELAMREAENRALAALAELQAAQPETDVIRRYSSGEEAYRDGLTDPLLTGARYPTEVWNTLLGLPRGTWTPKPFRRNDMAVILKIDSEETPAVQRTLQESLPEIEAKIQEGRRAKDFSLMEKEIVEGSKYQPNMEAIKALTPLKEIIR